MEQVILTLRTSFLRDVLCFLLQCSDLSDIESSVKEMQVLYVNF